MQRALKDLGPATRAATADSTRTAACASPVSVDGGWVLASPAVWLETSDDGLSAGARRCSASEVRAASWVRLSRLEMGRRLTSHRDYSYQAGRRCVGCRNDGSTVIRGWLNESGRARRHSLFGIDLLACRPAEESLSTVL